LRPIGEDGLTEKDRLVQESGREAWTSEQLQRVIDEALFRAATDHRYRKLALENAARAIARITPKPLPNGITLEFVDNSGAIKTVPLPPPLTAAGPMSEAELQSVSAGFTIALQFPKVK
jgi:hypothetical protein